MGLDAALTGAISGLRVSQEALGQISQNITNANSDNYTRRIITQTNEVLDGKEAGAKIGAIRRAVDNFLVESTRRQASGVGESGVVREFYDRMQLFFGAPGAENSVNVFIDDFFASLSDLANNTERTFFKTGALERSINLTDKVSALAKDIETVRFDVDQEISATVTKLNKLLDTMDNVNISLEAAARLGVDTNSLLDTRDVTLLKISSIIDVSVNFDAKGRSTIFVPKAEILGPSQKYRIDYTPTSSVTNMINSDRIGEISIVLKDSNGNDTTSKTTLVSASDAKTKEVNLSSGELFGLIKMRDTELPKLTAQLDELVDTLKNAFNAIHNDGGGFPPPTSLTGLTKVKSVDEHLMSGKVRIGVLKSDGTPAGSPFGAAGIPPLTIDLGKLNSGSGAGFVTVQNIVDEINEYYGPPSAKSVAVGSLSDLKIAAVSSSISTTKATGTIQFVGNPSAGETVTINGTVFTFIAGASSGTNIQIKADVNSTVTELTARLNAYVDGGTVDAATYTGTTDTLTITHDTGGTAANAYTIATTAGSVISGATLSGGLNASGNFTFDFEFMNVASKDATFEVLSVAVDNGAAGAVTVLPAGFSAFTAKAGERVRTDTAGASNDNITIDLTGSTVGEGGTHTITTQVKVTDGSGTISIETVDFVLMIPDSTANIRNKRYVVKDPPLPVGGGPGVVTSQNTNQRLASASIVDANGNTVAAGGQGFLKITANQTGMGIIIDEMTSSENGFSTPSLGAATSKGFSHYFGLNDFFESGSTLKNSAVNFKVRDSYKSDPSRLSTAQLSLSTQPSDPTANPIYTYEIGPGGNGIVTKLSELKFLRSSFDAAGTLPNITITFSGYSSEIISFASLGLSNAERTESQEKLLFDAFDERNKAFGAVNVDEELANTILFQNNYTASARIVNVVSEMFKTLIDMI